MYNELSIYYYYAFTCSGIYNVCSLNKALATPHVCVNTLQVVM